MIGQPYVPADGDVVWRTHEFGGEMDAVDRLFERRVVARESGDVVIIVGARNLVVMEVPAANVASLLDAFNGDRFAKRVTRMTEARARWLSVNDDFDRCANAAARREWRYANPQFPPPDRNGLIRRVAEWPLAAALAELETNGAPAPPTTITEAASRWGWTTD